MGGSGRRFVWRPLRRCSGTPCAISIAVPGANGPRFRDDVANDRRVPVGGRGLRLGSVPIKRSSLAPGLRADGCRTALADLGVVDRRGLAGGGVYDRRKFGLSLAADLPVPLAPPYIGGCVIGILAPMLAVTVAGFFSLLWLVRRGKFGPALSIGAILGAVLVLLLYATGGHMGLHPVTAMEWALIYILPALLGSGAGALLGWLMRRRAERSERQTRKVLNDVHF